MFKNIENAMKSFTPAHNPRHFTETVPNEIHCEAHEMTLKAFQVLQSGFEGCEKKLEMEFTKNGDIRSISREKWEKILDQANCSIISYMYNDHCDSYLLSESSLFVYPHKIMLKTCGTTALIHCIAGIIAETENLDLSVSFVQYSRTTFMYPKEQPFPHQDFSSETEYLNQFFDGSAYIFGPTSGSPWHVYIADMDPDAYSSDQSLEIVMFDLPEDTMAHFHRKNLEAHILKSGEDSGLAASETSGISKIVGSGKIDAFVFDPCGYSCNVLDGPGYFTIHITPEPDCCFVSFDTNFPVSSYKSILCKVVNIFRPAKFAACIMSDESAPLLPKFSADLFGSLSDYVICDMTMHRFKGSFSAGFACFEEKGDSKTTSFGNNSGAPELFSHIPRSVSAQHLGFECSMGVKECIKKAVDGEVRSSSLLIVDLGTIRRNLESIVAEWPTLAPSVQPFKMLKPGLIQSLANLNCLFDCHSQREVRSLSQFGIPLNQVVYNVPFKTSSEIKTARDFGIGFVVAHSLSELDSLALFYPGCQILLKIRPQPRCIVKEGDVAFLASSLFRGIDLCNLPEAIRKGVNISGLCLHHDFSQFMSFKDLGSFLSSVTGLVLNLIHIDSSGFDPSLMKELANQLSSLFPRSKISIPCSEMLISASMYLACRIEMSGTTLIEDVHGMDRAVSVYHISDRLMFSRKSVQKHSENVTPLQLEEIREEPEFSVLTGPANPRDDTLALTVFLPKHNKGKWIYFADVGKYMLQDPSVDTWLASKKVHYILSFDGSD